MEPISDQFCIAADKELTLRMLKLNNIPAVEIAEADSTSYPIVGRRFGSHGGQDVSIVHTKEQGLDEGFDYFTKLYAIEQEYRLEIEDLSVVRVQVAFPETVVSSEIPIRTEKNGWKWSEIDGSEISEDWMQMAIRAVYIIGLSHAYVKIGKLASEASIVIDINPLPLVMSKPLQAPLLPFTMGADVEFMLSCDDELIPASDFFPLDGSVGCDERQIEQDSGDYALAEIRPMQSDSPHELYNNMKQLISEASEKIPYDNIAFRAGSMPFFGYQCGGHLHFGVKLTGQLLRALDYYLAIPLAMIEESCTSRRRRKTKHGGLGRFREKPYGFEYLSLSSWIVEPQIALATLCLARLITAHHHELPPGPLFQPIVQRAYYQGNQFILKYLWSDIKSQFLKTAGYSLYEKELSFLFDFIENGRTLEGSTDIRKTWGLIIPQQSYDSGSIIYVPRKTRMKFNLTEGQNTFVCAGKSISKATIRPYPFSFRNSNIIQLSPALRETLSLPEDWTPKIASANGALILGPILGILADRPFEMQATYFQLLNRIAQAKQMFVYVFEPKDILWDKQLIKGTTINGEGIFPFPAVIYDRFFRNSNLKKKEMEEIRAKLQFVYNIPFINPPSLFDLTGNKWASHQLLSLDHQEYLPDARLLEQPSDITEMLNLHGEIFIKPVGGALSYGIVRVIQKTSGLYWMRSEHPIFQPLQGIDELTSHFFPLKKNRCFLVQEAIKRKQFNGNYVELRSYLQKNGKQKWMRTGMVARLTNEGVMSEETEINKRSSQVLNKLYPDPVQLRWVKKQIAEVTISVAEAFEEEIGTFGELAVDICIDEYDNIKILEINSKPDNLFSSVKAFKLRNLAAVRLLNYATSLAGFEMEDK